LRSALAGASGDSDALASRISNLTSELGGLGDGVDPMEKKFRKLVEATEGIEKKSVPAMNALVTATKQGVIEMTRLVDLSQKVSAVQF
jgi:hypothetical protein